MMIHILHHKTSLNKFKRFESYTILFSDHNAIKLEINYHKIFGKIPKYLETNILKKLMVLRIFFIGNYFELNKN